MESPQTSKRKVNESDTRFLKVNCTPKNCKNSSIAGEEFCLYNLHRESSPNFRAGQDVLEVGWGDSPEPLNVEQKVGADRSSITCKKKLETKESPKSSLPFKRRNVRSTFSIPSKSVVDISKYVAEVQELSKNIMREFNAQKIDKDLFEDEDQCTRFIENNPKSRLSSVCNLPSETLTGNCDGNNQNNQNRDPTFDNVLESFINEEDDWLSQALSSQEQVKTLKGNFVKSKSENELTIPQSVDFEKKSLTQNCRNLNNNFRRTSSFDLTKPPNSFSVKNINDPKQTVNNNTSNAQYSLQEIEKKRLEAKYRKERREIERKKLEALKKLEMKKLRVIKTKPSVIELVNKIV